MEPLISSQLGRSAWDEAKFLPYTPHPTPYTLPLRGLVNREYLQIFQETWRLPIRTIWQILYACKT